MEHPFGGHLIGLITITAGRPRLHEWVGLPSISFELFEETPKRT